MNNKNSIVSRLIYTVASNEVVSGFKKLYGVKQADLKIFEYYTKKLKLSFAVFIIGILGYFIFPYIKPSVFSSPYEISRNGHGGGSRSISIGYRFQGSEDKSMELLVDEKKYTEDELEKLFTPFEYELEKTILDKNISFEHVTTDMNFVSQIKNYPFTITYKTNKPALLSYSGKIDKSKITEDDGLVTIIITVRCDDYKKDIYKFVQICEAEKTGEEKLYEQFKNELKECDEKTKYSDNLRLPDNVDGVKIQYFEKGINLRIYIPVIALIFAVILFIGNNDDLKKEIKKRDEELVSEYPMLINKFAVFYNAGMPINVIWIKLCNEYENNFKKTGCRKYLYEEMCVIRMMIADGKTEIEAYEDFAKRCGLRQYKVFVSLIQQAITKGKGDMAELLKKEAEEAFAEKKNNAKKLSEEASSKLLLPMFMMLIVVMIMIMFPAFNSFN